VNHALDCGQRDPKSGVIIAFAFASGPAMDVDGLHFVGPGQRGGICRSELGFEDALGLCLVIDFDAFALDV
jgi:hypothetical protein